MHAETRIVIELYDVTGMSEDFTMAPDQEERRSLRIGGEKYSRKYYVACSPGRVRCNNNDVMKGVTICHTEQIR